jgi:hypothetical protein
MMVEEVLAFAGGIMFILLFFGIVINLITNAMEGGLVSIMLLAAALVMGWSFVSWAIS